ncbi:MAG: hypothetical protein IPK94_18780 [Saprospiraceae bacterium]|mgnify:CR=1 FL=1|jgi:predicted amidohydrolase|nr:hypothetical protein [Saprospiraceae bacterium]MBK6480112.1 hypothetical protein [Saprospiraceae bacterium]MBK6815032.1 hypothetical protein [Saprospiraceae bacterium]MBK7372076.1 hypothetical protein [Saprospiraceae bacterium]MBK7435465.1 hypothetical protein [Saprospiraceae bacterium]
MEITTYISNQPLERQNLLMTIHETILKHDKSVKAEVGSMMGKTMIIYKGKGLMKYGLSSVKNYISLHALPIYGSTVLHSKYKTLLPTASFQKGCINFIHELDMPLDIVKELITDCSLIDLLKMKEAYLESKKAKK